MVPQLARLAYFQWLNAHGGVYGRRIEYRVLDDRGGVKLVPSLAHRLVLGDQSSQYSARWGCRERRRHGS